MRKYIQQSPLLVRLIMRFKQAFLGKKKFTNSKEYWENRYKQDGNSGSGSYDHLAEFKAEIINLFVKENQIETIVEFGSGDGNQLRYFDFPQYLGVDVSSAVISLCQQKFASDSTKKFVLSDQFEKGYRAELTMSLDVIYHLVEDEVYNSYMDRLFSSSSSFVIIYSSNEEKPSILDHVRSRKFTDWVEKNQPEFELINFIPNKYPIGSPGQEMKSIADFYIYQLKSE